MSLSEMTPKERVLAAIKYEEVDRLPVFGHIQIGNQLINRTLNRDLYLDSDALVEGTWAVWKYLQDDNLHLNYVTISEPFGSKTYWPENDYPMIKDVLVKDHADADSLPDPDPYQDPYFIAMLKAVRELKKRAGDHVLISSVICGPFNLAGLILGTEKLMVNLVRDPELDRKVFRKVVDKEIRYGKALIEAGVGHILLPDATSSPSCLSPKEFGKWALPYLTEMVREFQSVGAIVSYHPCGGEYPIIDQIGQTGAEVLNFSELVDLDVAQKIFVGRHAVAGTVDASRVLFLGTPEEVDTHVKGIIEKLRFKTGAIITPGCGLSPNIPYENVKAMVDAVKKYSKN